MVQRWRLPVSGVFVLVFVVATAVAAPAKSKWLRASADEFTIITSMGPKETIARANEFSQYIAALRSYLTPPPGKLPPLTIVVFGSFQEFDRYRPVGGNGKSQPVAGFFIRHDTWAVIETSRAPNDAARQTIFHEGVHWYLSGLPRPLPLWLEEGMAEVFSTFQSDGRHVRWGRELPGRAKLLHDGGPLLTRKLTRYDSARLFAEDVGEATHFYAHAWAFVHYLLFGDHALPRDAAQKYVALLDGGTEREKAFEQAFGCTYREMDVTLKAYINGGRYRVSRQPRVPVPAVRVQPAPEDDVDEALGRVALVGKRYGLAIDHARAMVARHPDDPRGHALLGLALKESRRDEEAVAAFEQAVRNGSTDFRPYFEVAYALHRDQAGINAVLSPDVARRAADLYDKALSLHPTEEGYANFATLVGAMDPVHEHDRHVLAEALSRFPGNFRIQIGMAQMERRLGNSTGARERLGRVLAAGASLPGPLDAYARRVQEAWDAEDILQEVSRLMQAHNYADALALLEQRLAQTATPARRLLAPMRNQLAAAAAAKRLKSAVADEQWDVARQLVVEILESDAPPVTKGEAKRIQADLERRSVRSGAGRLP